MTPTTHISQYPVEEIPIRQARDNLAIYRSRLHALIKKHTKDRKVKLSDEAFNADLEKLITQIDSQAFNRGLNQMDRMHGMADRE